MKVLITMYNRTIKKRPIQDGATYDNDLHNCVVQCILNNIPMASRNIPRNIHTHLYYTEQIFMTMALVNGHGDQHLFAICTKIIDAHGLHAL